MSRNEFIEEIYDPMMEEREYRNLQAINEWRIKDLFGKIRNLFVDDWKRVEGNEEIKKIYKEFDDKLTGFTTMKMSRAKDCNLIRKELVGFAEDWYDYMEDKAKDSKGEGMKPVTAMKFKDDTLADNLSACKKTINTIAKDDQQMKEWAQILMDDMKSVINRIIVNDLDEDGKKEAEEMEKEAEKKNDKINAEEEKIQNKELEAISKERENLISKSGASKILKNDDNGQKAATDFSKEFEKLSKVNELFEGVEIIEEADTLDSSTLAMLKNDNMLGLNKIYEGVTEKDKRLHRAFNIMKLFYKSLGDANVAKKFADTPGQSVQAMCIAVNAYIKICSYGYLQRAKAKYADYITLMTKCAIASDKTLSYNLPLASNDKEGNRNYFYEIMEMIGTGKMEDNENKIKIEYSNTFKLNAEKLKDEIQEEAEKLAKEGAENRQKLRDSKDEDDKDSGASLDED